MDLGKKQETASVIEASKEDKDKICYPSLYLSDIPDLPFGEGDAGKEFNITGKVKVNSITKRIDGKKDGIEVSLDILDIEFEKRKGKADLAKSLKE